MTHIHYYKHAVRIAVDGPPFSQWDIIMPVVQSISGGMTGSVGKLVIAESNQALVLAQLKLNVLTCINLDAWEQFLSEEREKEELEASVIKNIIFYIIV